MSSSDDSLGPAGVSHARACAVGLIVIAVIVIAGQSFSSVSDPAPEGRRDNSPAIYRWVDQGEQMIEVPEGRLRRVRDLSVVPPGLAWSAGTGLPSDKSLGYFRRCLRHGDWACLRPPLACSFPPLLASWLPESDDLWRVVSLRDYNTRIVLLGTTLLGACGGVIGTFMLLRKRALVGDVVGHASLPGVAVAFIAAELIAPGSGRSLPLLLGGAMLAGLLGVLCTNLIGRYSRIKEDAALAIVLSVFFGIGVALLQVARKLPTGQTAGLDEFIFGKTAAMIADDVKLIGAAAVVLLLVVMLLYKEFAMLCFDRGYTSALGWHAGLLDFGLMALVVSVAVIGLQSVGMILVVAILVIPSAAARFWTDRLHRMIFIAAVLGGLSASLGSVISGLYPRMAAGATIVLVGSLFFIISMFFGTRRGIVRRTIIQRRLRYRVGRHDLLRAIYECLESRLPDAEAVSTHHSVTLQELLAARSWSSRRLHGLIVAATGEELLWKHNSDGYRLTDLGVEQSRRTARNHRLWELYLIHYAEIAPSHVDRDADQIEHILDPELIDELEEILAREHPHLVVPKSPHAIEITPAAAG